MKPTVLLYNIKDRTRLLKIHQALMPLGFRIKLVDQQEFGLPVGVVAGFDPEPGEGTEVERVASKSETEILTGADTAGFDDEMAVMAGFTSAQVDAFILALRKKGIGRIDYKAVLTPTNRKWDSVTLYRELKKEHEMYMKK